MESNHDTGERNGIVLNKEPFPACNEQFLVSGCLRSLNSIFDLFFQWPTELGKKCKKGLRHFIA